MRVVVLGAGVVGVTTAYYLAKRGFQVIVVDRAESVASGASFANGSQLSYSFTDALARPGMPARIPALLFGADPAIRIRPPVDIDFLSWGLTFLGQCTRRRFESNTVAVLRLALQSAVLLRDLVEECAIDFSYRNAGKLVLLRTKSAMAAAATSVTIKNENGGDVKLLSMQDACRIEPSLASMRAGYAGAVFSAGDDVGDAATFSTGLADRIRRQSGVEFRLGCTATEVLTANGRVTAVMLQDGTLQADAVVVCLGASSTEFLRALEVRLPVIPVRGYSVTLPEGRDAPKVSVSDTEHRIVLSSMNGFVRIAGFADFVGFDDSADETRIEKLLRIAKSVAPEAADYSVESRQPWGGLRPMTANSQPIVGPAKTQGLYLNCGHGMLGWTLACATGFNVAEQIALQA